MAQSSIEIDDARISVNPSQSRKYTGLGLPTTYRLIEEGVIPAIWTGRGWLIPLEGLKRSLNEAALRGGQRQRRARKHQ
jgi:excisionase family DNA binding protein